MTGFALPATLQHIEKPGEIGIQISMRVLQRITNTGLGGQMHHGSELDLAKEAFSRVTLREIDLVERELVEFAEHGQARLLQRRIIIMIDAVDDDPIEVGL